MPSKYGFGNTRKKSPYGMKNKPAYAMHMKNPVKMTAKQEANLPPELKAEISKAEGSPMDMYSKPHKMHSEKPMKKYASAAQRKAVHASKAEKK